MTILDNSPPGDTDASSIDEPVGKAGDKIFFGLSFGAAALILVTLAAVAIFLFLEGLPIFTSDTAELDGDGSFVSYVGPLVFGTIYISVIALVLATPVAIAVALYVSHYAPRKLAQSLGSFIDLLAAIPSVVYGLWGITVLAPVMARSVFPWLRENLGFIPLFGSDVPIAQSGRSTLTVGVVLAVMILPIITAISREVFIQTPRLARRGVDRSRCHPLGDDPPGGDPLRSLGRDLRGDARPRSSARRDDGGRHHPLAGEGLLLGRVDRAELELDRGQHRTPIPRVVGPGGQPSDRDGARVVRHHLRGERDRSTHRQRGFSGADG